MIGGAILDEILLGAEDRRIRSRKKVRVTGYSVNSGLIRREIAVARLVHLDIAATVNGVR